MRTALAAALFRADGPVAALDQPDRFCVRIPDARASTAACVLLDRESGAVRWRSSGSMRVTTDRPSRSTASGATSWATAGTAYVASAGVTLLLYAAERARTRAHRGGRLLGGTAP